MLNSLYQSRNNVFESINLDSTISDNNNTYNKVTTVIPESASATSDDELDPTEFLSTDNKKNIEDDELLIRDKDIPNSLKASTILAGESTNVDIRTNIDDHEFFLNPSKILASSEISSNEIKPDIENSTISSVYFPKKETIVTSGSENPIEFLVNKLKIIEKELSHNSEYHIVALETGDKSLNKIRSMIGQNFDQLSETYYPLYELYDSELTYTKNFLKGFMQWENNRNRILSKVKQVKSTENKDGKKLLNLLSQSEKIDKEIATLEEKIALLKTKKKIISEEIQSTSSVLESKTSKYIDAFKKLEQQGKNAILEFLPTNFNFDIDYNFAIKSIPVDVTFSRNYKKKENIDENTTSIKLENKENKANNNIGMVVYEYKDPIEPTDYFKDKKISKNDPYNEGFENGSKLSKKIKNQLDHIVKLLLPHENPQLETQKSYIIDDKNNTINEKIDSEPLLKVINGRLEALKDFSFNSSMKSKIYHEYSNIWKDIVAILKLQESKISRHIAQYMEPCEELETGLLDLLKETALKIEASISNLPPLANLEYKGIIITSILKEVEAINNASKLILNEGSTNKILDEIKNIFNLKSNDSNLKLVIEDDSTSE